VNLWEFFSEMRALYDSPLGEQVSLVWDYPSDLPPVQGDRRKLRQILENLINNAIKFTDEGTITVSVRYLPAKKTLELKVADTGIGIPQEQISKIFDRFRQGSGTSTSAPHAGMGLGLYVVKKYLELLGGKIHVESRVGGGSVFALQIPAPMIPSYSPHEQLLLPTDEEQYLAAPR
jgi:signal transduction histidine kinase